MVVQYDQYEHISPFIGEFREALKNRECRFYASDLMALLGKSFEKDFEFTLRKAITVCKMAHIPARDHFKLLFRSLSNVIVKDWKLSALACSLLIMESDSSDKKVVELQQELIGYTE